MAYTEIDDPSAYFQTALYTGNGGTQSIVHNGNSDLQPDWVWCKVKSGDNHAIFDSVRGGQKQLRSNTNGAELSRSNAISSFNSDGFTMGGQPEMNTNNATYVTWNWKAGTSFSNSAGANGASIASTGSVSTTAGFSIGTYTGNATNNATVAHGLSSAPQMIIVKQRGSDGDNWQVYWNDGTERNGFLNLTNGFNTPAATQQWGDNVPTSSVFTLGSDTATNVAGNLVFYAFHSVQGYSKFGSYIGNGNADGTFVYTGFKPAFVMIKITDDTDNWVIYDNKRDGFNGDTHALFPNITDAQTTDVDIDLLSNGFKIVRASGRVNASGNLFIYMAFAEQPFVTSTGVPATAR